MSKQPNTNATVHQHHHLTFAVAQSSFLVGDIEHSVIGMLQHSRKANAQDCEVIRSPELAGWG